MRRIVTDIKESFDRKKTRVDEKPCGLQHFWAANDHFSLAEILPLLDGAAAAPVAKNVVNILVGESDIYSLIHKLQGDIIICDIDRQLLDFIEQQDEFLRELYERYTKREFNFPGVIAEYRRWLASWSEDHPNQETAVEAVTARSSQLGESHFLYNEKNYQRAMEALKTKKIETLDIDLFDHSEQTALCEALREENAAVKLFNATNLPDYDSANNLSPLFLAIPWDKGATIAWNIHDKGPTTDRARDTYTQYQFLTSTPQEYQQHAQTRADFFADIDRITLGLEHIDEQNLRRYAANTEYLQEAAHADNRQRYLDRFRANQQMRLNTQSICETYNCRLPRSRNSMLFVAYLEQILEEAYSIICEKYKDTEIRAGVSHYLDQWFAEARKRDLRSPESQSRLKSDMINDAKTQLRAHRSFNTDKHWICKAVLNLFMLIPIFGGIKYAATGTYFFSSQTRREAMVVERIQQAVLAR